MQVKQMLHCESYPTNLPPDPGRHSWTGEQRQRSIVHVRVSAPQQQEHKAFCYFWVGNSVSLELPDTPEEHSIIATSLHSLHASLITVSSSVCVCVSVCGHDQLSSEGTMLHMSRFHLWGETDTSPVHTYMHACMYVYVNSKLPPRVLNEVALQF